MFLSRVELGARAAEHETFWREVSQPYGAHRALWKLLGRGSDQKREFLFRSEEARDRLSFLVLSAHQPESSEDGFWSVEPKPFAPALKEGQRLGFKLRASPVVSRGERVEGKTSRRVHRHDVVIDLVKTLEAAGKPVPDVAPLTQNAGLAWLRSQGERAGFRLGQTDIDTIGDDGLLDPGPTQRDAVRVEGYQQHRIHRRGETPIRYSTLDFEGVLEVIDPVRFLAKVAAGFGPQKAFGCGLMLLRRA